MDGFSGFARSISEDFSRFATRFVNERSFSFIIFKTVWQELHFDELYAGRGNNRSCYLFGKDLMRCAIDYLCPDNQPLMRALGLYLGYTIHHTYPHETKLMVRMSVKEWVDLVDFIKQIDKDLNNEASVLDQHQDMWHVVHVFNLLQREKAFCLCFSKKEMLPASHSRYYGDDGDIQELFTQHNSFKNIFGYDAMDELEAVKEEYDLSKEEAIKIHSDLMMSLVPEQDILQQIKEELSSFDTWKESMIAGKRKTIRNNAEDENGSPERQADVQRGQTGKRQRNINKRKFKMECKFTPKRVCKDSGVAEVANNNFNPDATIDEEYDEVTQDSSILELMI